MSLTTVVYCFGLIIGSNDRCCITDREWQIWGDIIDGIFSAKCRHEGELIMKNSNFFFYLFIYLVNKLVSWLVLDSKLVILLVWCSGRKSFTEAWSILNGFFARILWICKNQPNLQWRIRQAILSCKTSACIKTCQSVHSSETTWSSVDCNIFCSENSKPLKHLNKLHVCKKKQLFTCAQHRFHRWGETTLKTTKLLTGPVPYYVCVAPHQAA